MQTVFVLSFSDLSPYAGAIIPIIVSTFVYLLTFAFTMGNSAYYRIPTQYGIASLPMAICQIIVAIFSLTVVFVLTIFVGSLIIAIVLLLIAFLVGMGIVLELRNETSIIEWGVVLLGITLFILFIFANLYSSCLPLLGSKVNLFGLRFSIVEFLSVIVAMVISFFEAGFIAAKCKRFYLVNPENKKILLAEYSGDRFFFGYLSEIEYIDDRKAPIGYLSGECSFNDGKDASGKYVWCEFRRVVMKRGNERLKAIS